MLGQAIINRKELHPTSTNKMTYVAVETWKNRRLQHFTSDHGCAICRRLLAPGVPEQTNGLSEVNAILTRPAQTKDNLRPHLSASLV